MKKILLTISGVYSVLAGCLLGGVFFLLALSRGTLVGLRLELLLLMIVLPLLPIVTGIGILLKKNWARLSLLIGATMTLFVGVVVLLITLFMWSPNILSVFVSRIFMFCFSLIFMIVIPGSFIFFFRNVAVRKELFHASSVTLAPRRSPLSFLRGRPIGVLLIAMFWAFNVVSTALLVLNTSVDQVPFIGSILLSGWSFLVYFLFLTTVFLYNCVGLLRMKRLAWWTNIMTVVFIITTSMLNTFFMTEDVFERLAQRSAIGISISEYKTIGLMSLLIPIIIIIYLIFKRDLFRSSRSGEENK